MHGASVARSRYWTLSTDLWSGESVGRDQNRQAAGISVLCLPCLVLDRRRGHVRHLHLLDCCYFDCSCSCGPARCRHTVLFQSLGTDFRFFPCTCSCFLSLNRRNSCFRDDHDPCRLLSLPVMRPASCFSMHPEKRFFPLHWHFAYCPAWKRVPQQNMSCNQLPNSKQELP